MINAGLNYFQNKRVLMLQGPIGPFFNRLRKDLIDAGATVTKIDFNGGDWLFSGKGSIQFRGNKASWPAFFERVVKEHRIDTVLLMGDCRHYHRVAREIAHRNGMTIGVFEEGYVRPDYITFELFGVNANSKISRVPEDYLSKPKLTVPEVVQIKNPLWFAVRWSMLYYGASILLRPWYPFYEHHRPLEFSESWPWLRSYFRKLWYGIIEEGIQEELVDNLSGKYYLVPLQVHNDSQLQVHSNFSSVQNFIHQVMQSFAKHAPPDTHLILKQHPLDRGYNNHRPWITELSKVLQVEDRVKYIHDQHLPTLLDHARGVVVVNSTVGLSALHHGIPTKVCGVAIFDILGMTCQCELDNFWLEADTFEVNTELYEKFRNYVIVTTQVNGNFYRRLDGPVNRAGVIWSKQSSN